LFFGLPAIFDAGLEAVLLEAVVIIVVGEEFVEGGGDGFGGEVGDQCCDFEGVVDVLVFGVLIAELGYAGVHVVEETIGEGKAVAEAGVFEQGDADGGIDGVGGEIGGGHIAFEDDLFLEAVFFGEGYCLIEEVAGAADDEAGIDVLHGGDELLEAAAYIYPALVEDVALGFLRNMQGTQHGGIAHDAIVHAVSFFELGGIAVANGVASAEVGYGVAAYPCPHFMHRGAGDDFFEVGKDLVGIVHALSSAQYGRVEDGEYGVEVYGAEGIGGAEKEEEE